jgi:hypothetical protein
MFFNYPDAIKKIWMGSERDNELWWETLRLNVKILDSIYNKQHPRQPTLDWDDVKKEVHLLCTRINL